MLTFVFSYLPPIAESQVNPDSVSFSPDARRTTLFRGMKFIFLSQRQVIYYIGYQRRVDLKVLNMRSKHILKIIIIILFNLKSIVSLMYIGTWVGSTIYTRRYVARVDKSHPLIVLSSQFSVTDPLISRMVDSLAAEVSPSLITDITFSQVIEISTWK